MSRTKDQYALTDCTGTGIAGVLGAIKSTTKDQYAPTDCAGTGIAGVLGRDQIHQ